MRKRIGLAKGAAVVAAGCLFIGATAATALASGEADYAKNCVTCHGAAGKGDGPVGKMMKPAPKDFATALKGQGDDAIAKVIKEGGKAVGKATTMPAYGSKLNDDQIKELVAYIKGLGSK